MMIIALMLTDALSLFVACFLAIRFWLYVLGRSIPSFYTDLIPLLLVFLIIYQSAELYTTRFSPVDELRKITMTTTVGFIALAGTSFWFRNAELYSRASFGISWVFSLILLPINRSLLRFFASRMGVWGEPVAIIGSGEIGNHVAQFLIDNPTLGYKPVIAIDGLIGKRVEHGCLPVVESVIMKPNMLEEEIQGIQTAILIKPEVSEGLLELIIERQIYKFSRLLLVSGDTHGQSLWVETCDIGGLLALEVRQNLLNHWQRVIKRVLDLSIIIACSPFLIPVLAVLALIIKLDYINASIFYNHNRVGKEGELFKMMKFRTMVPNADKILLKTLDESPALQKEWSETPKLKRDPRITRIGRIMRALSLDEWPQIWNVVKGEMSLVGPRPILQNEMQYYGKSLGLYRMVQPGMTGLWQVSGRSNLDFVDRVALDEYYVRNWSIWLDIYILAKTALEVLKRTGAY